MGEDERGTLRRIKAIRRELVDPSIAEHHGRVVKTTGDGILIEYPSAVEAVGCAVAIQRMMAERNAGMPTDGSGCTRVTSSLTTRTSSATGSTWQHGLRP
jgi:adenylate cyclase